MTGYITINPCTMSDRALTKLWLRAHLEWLKARQRVDLCTMGEAVHIKEAIDNERRAREAMREFFGD